MRGEPRTPMLEVNRIREEKQAIAQALTKRGLQVESLLDEIIAVDDKRKQIQAQSDVLLTETNTIAKQIGDLFKQGKRDEAEAMKQRPIALK